MDTPVAPFLLTRVLLRFPTDDEDVIEEISAIHLADDGCLWVGADEGRALWRLRPDPDAPHVYGDAEQVHLEPLLALPGDAEEELDIEGMDAAGDHLWTVGSHSATRKKVKGAPSGEKARKRALDQLAQVDDRPARRLLARVPTDGGRAGAAVLRSDVEGLTDALRADPHLGPILAARIPAKDNGFDIEGLAVFEETDHTLVWLGLRGPVLRGWAVLLELEVEEREPGRLVPRRLEGGRPFRKRLLDLDGFGIRELQRLGSDLLVLSGPTMKHVGQASLFRLARPDRLPEGPVPQGDDLQRLFDLPFVGMGDKAEALTTYRCFGDTEGVLVGYDGPRPERRRGACSVWFDVFRLPGR